MKLIALLVLSVFTTQQPSKTYTEEQKISYLISCINKLDARFIRNGSEYSGTDAAEHLKMKRKKAGNQVKTARQFISNIAAKSSVSGEAYRIKFKDGRTETSEAYLLKQLKLLEQ